MQEQSVLEYPVYVRMPTEENTVYFDNKSSAEAVINTLISAQNLGWMRLHGFVVLPNGLEMVMSPLRQRVSGVVAHIQAEMTPVLAVLLPASLFVWDRHYSHAQIKTKKSLDARLNMLLLAPVAQGICDAAEEYPYSSANARYKSNVAVYAGFSKTIPEENPVLKGTGPLISSPRPTAPKTPDAAPASVVTVDGLATPKPESPPTVMPEKPPAAENAANTPKVASDSSPEASKTNGLLS